MSAVFMLKLGNESFNVDAIIRMLEREYAGAYGGSERNQIALLGRFIGALLEDRARMLLERSGPGRQPCSICGRMLYPGEPHVNCGDTTPAPAAPTSAMPYVWQDGSLHDQPEPDGVPPPGTPCGMPEGDGRAAAEAMQCPKCQTEWRGPAPLPSLCPICGWPGY